MNLPQGETMSEKHNPASLKTAFACLIQAATEYRLAANTMDPTYGGGVLGVAIKNIPDLSRVAIVPVETLQKVRAAFQDAIGTLEDGCDGASEPEWVAGSIALLTEALAALGEG